MSFNNNKQNIPINTRHTIEKTDAIMDIISMYMANQKQTGGLQQKLKDLNKALMKCIQHNPDIDTSSAYLKILEEVKENLGELQYYAEDFNKTSILRKKTKGSTIRRKMTVLQSSISNFTRLIESLTLTVGKQQYGDMSEESKGEVHEAEDFKVRVSTSSYEKKLQNKVQEFELKLHTFLKQQSQVPEDNDLNDLESANRQSILGGNQKSSRRITHNQDIYSSDNQAFNKKQGYDRKESKDHYNDIGLKRAMSEDITSPNRFNKAQEYCLEAHCLLHGHGIEPSTEDAILWYERSANLGEPKAMFALGNIYEKGIGVRVNIDKAIEYYDKAANFRDPSALYRLSKFYLKGGYVTLNEGNPDAQKAFELLEQASDENSKEAIRDLGYIYEKGGLQEGERFIQLVEVDLNKALDYYQRAVSFEDELALNYLGSFYFNHTKEFEKAVKFFREASEKATCERALNNLGICFEQGVGNAVQDYSQAIKLYEMSADLGYDQAMVNLGYLYYKLGQQGDTFNEMDLEELYFQSAYWLRMAIGKEEKNPEALFLLAKLYEEGNSVDKNIQLSYKYYETSANFGFAKALTKLGHYNYSGYFPTYEDYFQEFTLPINKLQALDYYQQATKQGDSEAANCIGLLFEQGFETYPKDLKKAQEYFQLALLLNKDNSEALFNLGLLTMNMGNNEDNSFQEGIKLIREAASKGNVRAKECLLINEIEEKQTNNWVFANQQQQQDKIFQDTFTRVHI